MRKVKLRSKKLLLTFEDKKSKLNEVRYCYIDVDNHPNQLRLTFDERFNEISFTRLSDGNLDFLKTERDIINDIMDYLKEKFNILKSSDFRYNFSDGMNGSKHITLEEFINHLVSDNRENLLGNLLK